MRVSRGKASAPRAGRRLFAALSALLLATAPAARAQTPGAQGASEPSRLEQARALFRSGVAMLDTGDYERALDFFLRSREAYPSPQNTIDAALCMDRLGRFDESLEMYETALATLSDKLDAQDSEAIAAATAELLRKVGNLDVSANVDGTVVVDGRQRGKLPLSSPIRVLAGTHVVRIVKDGYRTFEGKLEVRPGERAHVDGKLEPLEAAGQLRIEDPGYPGAEISVDGAVVGQSPWEGTLGPGSHVVWSRMGDSGSAPTAVVVLQGQTALVRLRAGPLGPPLHVEVRPETASITLSGVTVAAGTFDARLPVGPYALVLKEPGYFPRTIALTVAAGSGAPLREAVVLQVDPQDPRWPAPVARDFGHFWLGAFGGVGWGPTFGSAVEAGCPASCAGRPSVVEGLVGARAGFRFPFESSVELSGGYWSMGLTSDRTRHDVFTSGGASYAVDYHLHDDVRFAGPFVGLGFSHRLRLAGPVQLVPRATFGVLFGNVRNPVTGTASTAVDSVPLTVVDAGKSVSATRAVIAPELGLTLPWKGFELGVGVQVAFVPGNAVDFAYTRAQVDPSSCKPGGSAGAAACAPAYFGLSGERALGAFYVVTPVLGVARQF